MEPDQRPLLFMRGKANEVWELDMHKFMFNAAADWTDRCVVMSDLSYLFFFIVYYNLDRTPPPPVRRHHQITASGRDP
jgi:hypothetical protein